MSAEFSLLLLLMMMVMVLVLVTVTLLLKVDGDDLKRITATRWKGWAGAAACFRKARRGLRARFQTTQARLSGMRIPA